MSTKMLDWIKVEPGPLSLSLFVMVHDSVSSCFLYLISMPLCCVLCFDVSPPVYSLAAVCLLLSVSVFFSVLLPLVTSPGLLPPPSSPVPCLVVSVCVLSLCFPSRLCSFIASVCINFCSCSRHVLPELLLFLASSWYILSLTFAFLIWTLLVVLCLAVLLLLCLLSVFCTWLPWFLRSALKIKLAFCFIFILVPWVTAFGSYLLSLPPLTRPDTLLQSTAVLHSHCSVLQPGLSIVTF